MNKKSTSKIFSYISVDDVFPHCDWISWIKNTFYMRADRYSLVLVEFFLLFLFSPDFILLLWNRGLKIVQIAFVNFLLQPLINQFSFLILYVYQQTPWMSQHNIRNHNKENITVPLYIQRPIFKERLFIHFKKEMTWHSF